MLQTIPTITVSTLGVTEEKKSLQIKLESPAARNQGQVAGQLIINVIKINLTVPCFMTFSHFSDSSIDIVSDKSHFSDEGTAVMYTAV